MSSLAEASQRRRQNLNPLATQLGPPPPQFQAPNSAVSLSSPFHHQTPYTPASGVRQYNPQQWGGAQTGYSPDNGRYSPSPSDVVMAPAPPPYSPPRSHNSATSFSPLDSATSASPLNRGSPGGPAYRPSPEVPAAAFPPPPPTSRTRSRDRTQPLLSHLGNVFHRKPTTPEVPEPSRQRGSIDISRDQPSSSRPRGSVDIRDQPSSSHRPPPLNLEPSTEAFPVIVAEQRPPASRRAVSASAIGTPTGPSSRSRNSSTSRWAPGMPLPPPPPGPPPQSGSRSQSLSRPEGVDPIVSPPTRRPAPISTLGPVPPTPAGWVDSPRMVPGAPRPRSPLPPGALHLDTSSVSSSGHTESNSGSSSSGLTRAHAVRGEPKSIRERRSESRSGKAVAIEEPSNNPWAEAITPADIMVPPMTVLGRRPEVTKSNPSSARSFHNQDTPNSSRTPNYQSQNTPNSSRTLSHVTPRLSDIQQPESRGSTPRPLNSANRTEAPTPPFSPAQYPSRNSYQGHNPNIPPKSLPTPPPISRRRADSSPRPISHILHTPLKDQGMPVPLSPKRAPSRQSPSPAAESFSRAALQRHEQFILREASANTDEERIRLFADFIVSESRIRRELYTSAIDAMGSEVLELTRDLFRPYTHSKRSSFGSHSSTAEHKGLSGLPPLQTGPIDSAPSSASSMGSAGPGSRPESTWWTGYMPSLSPIPSMSASQAQEESSSRGRPSTVEEGVKVHGNAARAARVPTMGGERKLYTLTATTVISKGRSE
ncbi:hypothetical protein V501_05962 [Pseudogymnoascus sp. VKM F-4519 (FW-2642)]|nr:hypothetical protein V501_05962 [Pseudogymnoascus sp. VKM F-4519 (FW-2642)]